MKTQSFFFFFCIIPAVSQFFDCILIYLQILISNLLQGNLQQVKRRVNSHILGLRGAGSLWFYFNVIDSSIKKSLTSFVPNKHWVLFEHWFIFLHFGPVQIISLPQAHLTLTLPSITFLIYWFVIVTELVTSQLFWIVSCYNNFFSF